MNTTLPLPTLVKFFAESAGLERIVAGEFVHAFFDLISRTLADEGSVTIKGLGRFDVVDDMDNPVIFTPDSAMQRAVNSAFEVFDAIELDGDFDESALDMSHDSSAAPIDTPEPELQPVDDTTPEVETPDVETPEPIVEEENPVEISEDATVAEADEHPAEAETTTETEAEAETDTEIEAEPVTSDLSVEDNNPYYTDEDTYEPRSRGISVLAAIAMLLAGIIVGAFAGYVGRDKIGYVVNRMTASTTDSIAAGNSELTDDEPAVVDASQANDSLQPSGQTSSTSVQAEEIVPEKKEPATAEPKYDMVSENSFLTTLAGKYYGEKDYWVYIYEANSDILKHPDRIKPGTRVLIPDLGDILTGDKAVDKKNARQKSAEIYARFK
jgi:nucleoid-associated protein YgaU